MKNKRIVGVTQRVDNISSYNEDRDSIDERMISWVVEAGLIPVPIPNGLVDLFLSYDSQSFFNQWLESIGINGLILSGGNDIGEMPQRDLTENHLLTWAENNNKPVLGICRGMQMMGVYAGGKLIKVDGHVGSYHSLQVDENIDGGLSNIVNSYHNQVLKECPKSFKVLAKSEDGNLEAIAHKKLPWEGWMWHPEREDIFSKIDTKRLKKIMNNGKS